MTTTDLARPGPGEAAADDPERHAGPDLETSETGDSGRNFPRLGFGQWLVAITLAGLLIRILYVLIWKNPGPNYGDAHWYHLGANYLADGEGYIHPFQLESHGLRIPGADHPPGYLTILAAASFAGLRSFLAHQLLSCILGATGIVAMGLAGRRVAGARVGLITALIVAVSPNVWFHDAVVMSETLVAVTTGAIILSAYRWWDRPDLARAAWFGAALGVAALIRAEALVLGPAIAIPLVGWRLWRRHGEAAGSAETGTAESPRSWTAPLVQLAAAGAVVLGLLAPWTLYNLGRFENPVPISAQFDHTLVVANCDLVYYGPATGYWDQRCLEAVEWQTDPEDDASQEAVVFRRAAREYVADRPDRAVEVVGARIARAFGLYRPHHQIQMDHVLDSKEPGLGQVGLSFWFVVGITGVIGLVLLRRAGRAIFPIVAVVGATVVMVAITYGATRFRLPAELALCIPAAVTADALLTARTRRRSEAATPAPPAPAEPVPAEDDAEVETPAAAGPEALADSDPGVEAGFGSSATVATTTAPEQGSGLESGSAGGGRFAGFDGLRAIAALGVLLTHVALASGVVSPARSGVGHYLSRADVGVALFFALSGFLLYRPFVSARMDNRPALPVRRYLRHRFLRIFPAYWLALTVLAVVLDVRSRNDFRTPWDFVVYYGLLQSYSDRTALGGLQQAWTLTNEMAFYLLLPVWAAGAVWLARRVRPRLAMAVELGILAAAAAGGLLLRYWLYSIQPIDPATGDFDSRLHWIPSVFHLFVPGMALAIVYEWSRRRDDPLRVLEVVRRHPLVCWGLAAFCFWVVSTQIGLNLQVGSNGPRQDVQHQLLYAAIGILLMAPVALAGAQLPWSLRWLSTRVMVFLGVLSYGIYLWHEGITDLYRDARGYEQYFVGAFPPMLVATLAGSVVAAWISYRFLERPILALKDRDRLLPTDWRPQALPADALLVERPDHTEAVESPPKRRRLPAWVVPVAVIGVVVALPFWGLWTAPGPPMEEGFMLVFPERVLAGDIPNKDFLHLYGPGSLWALAGFFQVFGVDLWVERLVGLIQVLGLVVGTTVVGWRWGRWTAAMAGAVTAIIIMPPIQLTALAWVGGIALALWAVIVAVRTFDQPAGATDDRPAEAGEPAGPDGHSAPDGGSRPDGEAETGDRAAADATGSLTSRLGWLRQARPLFWGGLLGGVALLFRPDLVVALGLPFGAMWLWGLDWPRRRQLLFGVLAGASPYLVHLAMAGPGNAITGMVTEPIFKLRPGRRLPFPPPTDSLESFLNRAFVYRNWPWPFPALKEPQQVFVWVLVLVAVCAVLVAIGIKARRAGSPNGWRLLCLGLLALGCLPQVVQRADTAHLAWVSCVPFGLLPSALAEWGRLRGIDSRRVRAALLLAPVAIMFVLIPHYTVRWYADYVGQTFGYRQDGHPITHAGRTFYYGRQDVADAAEAMMADIDRLTEPGQSVIVGTGDLRYTAYSEAYLYFLLPDLVPGTRYIEMDPGMANAEDSGLADEMRQADVVILSTVYDNWDEPNTSTEAGSDEPNQVLDQEYCRFDRYGVQPSFEPDAPERPIYELYLRC